MIAHPVKRPPFWVVIAVAFGALALATWISRVQVEARQAVNPPHHIEVKKPLQQCAGTDLQIQDIAVEPDTPLSGQPYNVYVGITNGGDVTCTQKTLVYLYLDRDAVGDPDYQTIANTNGLGYNQVITANLTVSGEDATQGYHWIRVRVDATDLVAGECGGEDNNVGDETLEIQSGEPTPTSTPVPTSTPFPLPEIYSFAPQQETITRGESVTLRWQVYGEAVSVYLDGELVSMEDSWEVYPDQSHVYTLRAENPGGTVEETCRIIVLDPPTATPTATPTPCATPVIHYFDATSKTIYRGEEVTLFWDLSGADEAYLDGKGVSGVSQKKFTLKRTTTFTLLARNECGEAEETLTIDVLYATPTYTPRPTYTPTPTRTPTATRGPTRTPTPNLLPTFTPAPGGTETPSPTDAPRNTITPNVTRTQSAFDSPIDAPTGTLAVVSTNTPTATLIVTPTATLIVTPTATLTLTSTQIATLSTEATPTVTPTVTPTGLTTPEELATVTPTPTATAAVVAQNPTPTPVSRVAMSPLPSPTDSRAAGTVRMYLCPLAVLLVFAIGVIVLSFVLPRIRDRRDEQAAYTPIVEDAVFNPDEPLSAQGASVDTFSPFLPDDGTTSARPAQGTGRTVLASSGEEASSEDVPSR
jgi:hypothetical protein